jgi:Flp pilus assembly pilin Flp
MQRFRSRLRSEDGAAAVEAALIIPLLIFLLFGIIEISLLLRDHVATTSLVRAGARTASALPRSSTMVPDTVAAMERAGSALPKDSYEELWIYRADPNGLPIGNSASNKFATCGTDCVRYAWNDARDTFGKVSGNWDPLSINACPGDPNAMAVGVYLRARHDFITGVFGSGMTVSDYAVLKFEPVATYSSTQPCRP